MTEYYAGGYGQSNYLVWKKQFHSLGAECVETVDDQVSKSISKKLVTVLIMPRSQGWSN